MKSIGLGKFSLVSYYVLLIDFQIGFFFLFLETNNIVTLTILTLTKSQFTIFLKMSQIY